MPIYLFSGEDSRSHNFDEKNGTILATRFSFLVSSRMPEIGCTQNPPPQQKKLQNYEILIHL